MPAGNPDGGQWIDGGGGFASDRSSPSVDPIKTGATAARPRSNNDHVKPVSDSDQGQRRNLEFNESQKAELRRKIGSGKGAYVEAYKYLHQRVQNRLQTPGLSIAERKELEAKEFWLRKAGEINDDDPNSQGNFFIRSVTGNGLRFDDRPAVPEKIQGNSNRIGAFVMKDVLETGEMPSMQRIIANDALTVTDEEGKADIRWLGRFIQLLGYAFINVSTQYIKLEDDKEEIFVDCEVGGSCRLNIYYSDLQLSLRAEIPGDAFPQWRAVKDGTRTLLERWMVR